MFLCFIYLFINYQFFSGEKHHHTPVKLDMHAKFQVGAVWM